MLMALHEDEGFSKDKPGCGEEDRRGQDWRLLRQRARI
jgi:hypothetical protein